jgi:hypothetical protein
MQRGSGKGYAFRSRPGTEPEAAGKLSPRTKGCAIRTLLHNHFGAVKAPAQRFLGSDRPPLPTKTVGNTMDKPRRCFSYDLQLPVPKA